MAADSMRLRVVLDVVDRVLGPLKRISAGSNDAAKALKATRDRLKELNQQQAMVGDWRTMRAGLADTADKLAQAQGRVAQLARNLQAAGPPTRAMAREFASAKREAAGLGQQHERQARQVQELRDKLQAAGISTRGLSNHERELRSNINATTAEITRQNAALRTQADQQRQLAALREKHARTMLHTGMAAGVGAAMQATGRRGVQVGMGPVTDFAKHQDHMLGIARQVEGARDDAGNLTPVYRAIEEQIRGLSHRIPLATTAITDMVTAAARMEVPTDRLGEFTLMASEIATAFDAVPDQITESMGKVAKNFKIPLTDIRSLADSINYLDDNAISKGGDIIDFLNRTSGVVSTVAMKAQDAAALGSTLLTLGERAETAGTAANAIVQKFAAATKGTKKFQAAMAEIGLSPDAVQKGMSTDAMGTILKVVEAIRKLPEHKRTGVMVELAGMEHSDTLAKLVDKPEELQRQLNLANSQRAQGSMAREAAARNANLSAQWQLTSNRAFNLSSALGEALEPALLRLLHAINPLIEGVSAFVQENKTLVGWLLGAFLAVSALLVGLGALLVPLALLAGKAMLVRFLFQWLVVSMFGARAAAGAAAGGMGLLYRAGFIAGRAFALLRGAAAWLLAGLRVLAVFLIANPIVAAFALLAVAAYMVWRNWDGIKGGLLAIWRQLSDTAGALWDRAAAGAASLWQTLVSAKQQFFQAGSDLLQGLVDGITSRALAVRDAVVGVADAVGGWFREKLGINSPSRVFMQYGGWIAEGAAIGMQGGQGAVRTAALTLATAATAAAPGMAGAGPVRVDSRPPLSAAALAGAPAPAAAGNTYQITIHAAPGMDAQALARAVTAELDRRERAKRSRVLSQLADID